MKPNGGWDVARHNPGKTAWLEHQILERKKMMLVWTSVFKCVCVCDIRFVCLLAYFLASMDSVNGNKTYFATRFQRLCCHSDCLKDWKPIVWIFCLFVCSGFFPKIQFSTCVPNIGCHPYLQFLFESQLQGAQIVNFHFNLRSVYAEFSPLLWHG